MDPSSSPSRKRRSNSTRASVALFRVAAGRLPPPDLFEDAHDVFAEHLADVIVGVVVLDQPTHDVRKFLGWVLDAVDKLHFLELRRAVRGLDRQLARKGVVQCNVIAK